MKPSKQHSNASPAYTPKDPVKHSASISLAPVHAPGARYTPRAPARVQYALPSPGQVPPAKVEARPQSRPLRLPAWLQPELVLCLLAATLLSCLVGLLWVDTANRKLQLEQRTANNVYKVLKDLRDLKEGHPYVNRKERELLERELETLISQEINIILSTLTKGTETPEKINLKVSKVVQDLNVKHKTMIINDNQYSLTGNELSNLARRINMFFNSSVVIFICLYCASILLSSLVFQTVMMSVKLYEFIVNLANEGMM